MPDEDANVDNSTQGDGTGDSPPQEPNTQDVPPSDGDGVQKRIGKLTKKYRQAERDAQYWKGVAEARSTQQDSGSPQTKKPSLDRDDFESDSDWMDALEKRIEENLTVKLSERDQAAKDAEMARTIRTVTEKSREKYEDYDEVALDQSVPVTKEMFDAAMGDTLGDVLYFLGKNKDEAHRIANLTPIQQAKEIGRIEAKVTAAPTKTKTKTETPTPPKTVGGGGSPPPKSVNDMTYEERKKKWESDRRKHYGVE